LWWRAAVFCRAGAAILANIPVGHYLPGAPSYPQDSANLTSFVMVAADVVVIVPKGASAAKSLSISVNGARAIVANISAGSTGCIGTSPLVCTIPVSAPTSSDVFAIKTFGAAMGSGTALASGDVLQTITTTSKTVRLTLAGATN
jgi:hypothetical protein